MSQPKTINCSSKNSKHIQIHEKKEKQRQQKKASNNNNDNNNKRETEATINKKSTKFCETKELFLSAKHRQLTYSIAPVFNTVDLSNYVFLHLHPTIMW